MINKIHSSGGTPGLPESHDTVPESLLPPVPHAAEFEALFSQAAAEIESRYGIAVTCGELSHPFTGHVDGSRIDLHKIMDPELRFFTLLHLFGHAVAWNTSEAARLFAQHEKLDPKGEDSGEREQYEKSANSYGLALLHSLGVFRLDQWLADWAAADRDYFLHFRLGGECGDQRRFFNPGQGPQIEPFKIPEFSPRVIISRYSS